MLYKRGCAPAMGIRINAENILKTSFLQSFNFPLPKNINMCKMTN